MPRSGDVSIAYQVVGDGPRDLVRVAGWVTHSEVLWQEPSMARFLERLAGFSRPILFDERGGASRYMAERIPGAKFVELPGRDHLPWVGNADAILDEVEDFLTGMRRGPDPDRVLATVMFTDVESTRKAAELGDHRWRDVLTSFQDLARDHVPRFRGREIDTAGDGLLAAFDGPARAVRAAAAVRADVRRLGLEVRAGLHTAECEIMGAKLGGVAVHIGARIAGLAKGGEVLVSSTVRDLVAGSGLKFADRGQHALKGVPGDWHIVAVDMN